MQAYGPAVLRLVVGAVFWRTARRSSSACGAATDSPARPPTSSTRSTPAFTSCVVLVGVVELVGGAAADPRRADACTPRPPGRRDGGCDLERPPRQRLLHELVAGARPGPRIGVQPRPARRPRLPDAHRSRRVLDRRPPRAVRRSRGVRPGAAPGGQGVILADRPRSSPAASASAPRSRMALAERGMDVALSFNRSRDEADGRGRAIRRRPAGARRVQADVSSADDVPRARGRRRRRPSAGSTCSINMASVYASVPFDAIDDAHLGRVRSTSICGRRSCARARPCRTCARAGGGRIVNFSDWVAASGRPRYPGYLPYYVAKRAASSALTEALALELAGDQILVNAIAPGPILAPPGTSDEESTAVEAATPLGRWGGEERDRQGRAVPARVRLRHRRNDPRGRRPARAVTDAQAVAPILRAAVRARQQRAQRLERARRAPSGVARSRTGRSPRRARRNPRPARSRSGPSRSGTPPSPTRATSSRAPVGGCHRGIDPQERVERARRRRAAEHARRHARECPS